MNNECSRNTIGLAKQCMYCLNKALCNVVNGTHGEKVVKAIMEYRQHVEMNNNFIKINCRSRISYNLYIIYADD